MAHARKPKNIKRQEKTRNCSSSSQPKQTSNQQNSKQVLLPVKDEDDKHVAHKRMRPSSDEDNEEHAAVPKAVTVATVQGQKIQVQTAIEKLAKNMNRPSVFFKLGAIDFISQFTECFREHIEGFVGLRGSKRERSEKEKQMEWRQRVGELKKQKQKHADVKKNGQTVSESDRMLAIQRYRELRASKKNMNGE